jgi:outer membrane protein
VLRGLRPDAGPAVVRVYDSPSTFRDEERAVLAASVTVTNGAAEWVADGLAPGRYAVTVYQDLDGDGRMARSPLGIPVEPVGFSNNARPRFGPARFDAAAFPAGPGEALQEIELFVPAVGRGRWGLGVGAIYSMSPYAGVDDDWMAIPLLSYVGERFYFRGLEAGYRLAGGAESSLTAFVQYSFDVYESDDSEALRGMDDRGGKTFVGLSLEHPVTARIEFELAAAFIPAGLDEGQKLSARLGTSHELGGWRFAPGLGVEVLTQDFADWLYGVEDDETRPGRPAYDVGPAFSPTVRLNMTRTVRERSLFILGLEAVWFDRDIRRSPIVDRDYVVRGLAGITYQL